MDAWRRYLPASYADRPFLLDGIRDGFHLTSAVDFANKAVRQRNHFSATRADTKLRVEEKINTELLHGRYKLTASPPAIISALAAIPKPNGDIRLIHDASRPIGEALNDYADPPTVKFQTLDDAIALITPGAYLAKVDLSNAYRSVSIHPDDYAATGLAWKFDGDTEESYMYDTRLCFGASSAPSIFHRLTQAVRSIMSSLGYRAPVAYLDDFLIVEDSFEECKRTMNTLLCLLRQLGFSINYNKVEGPCSALTFLGIDIDTVGMCLALPAGKRQELSAILQAIYKQKSVSKRELQSLAGRLNWANRVVYGAKFFTRRVLDIICSLRAPWHRVRVGKALRLDLSWWIKLLPHLNGTMPIISDLEGVSISTDACPEGLGAVLHTDWVYTPVSALSAAAQTLPINYLEVLALGPAVLRWGHLWSNRRVYVHCDNQAATHIINKGSCHEPIVMDLLRHIWWLSSIYNFRLRAVYYPGRDNTLADGVSRLNLPTPVCGSFLSKDFGCFRQPEVAPPLQSDNRLIDAPGLGTSDPAGISTALGLLPTVLQTTALPQLSCDRGNIDGIRGQPIIDCNRGDDTRLFVSHPLPSPVAASGGSYTQLSYSSADERCGPHRTTASSSDETHHNKYADCDEVASRHAVSRRSPFLGMLSAALLHTPQVQQSTLESNVVSQLATQGHGIDKEGTLDSRQDLEDQVLQRGDPSNLRPTSAKAPPLSCGSASEYVARDTSSGCSITTERRGPDGTQGRQPVQTRTILKATSYGSGPSRSQSSRIRHTQLPPGWSDACNVGRGQY